MSDLAPSGPLRITFHEELMGLEQALMREGELVERSVQAATMKATPSTP